MLAPVTNLSGKALGARDEPISFALKFPRRDLNSHGPWATPGVGVNFSPEEFNDAFFIFKVYY